MIMIIVVLLIIITGYVIATYNKLQTLKTRIAASIQEIGNQLKRQAQLIPNLVNSAKGYLEHEKGIFDKLSEARKAIETAVKSNSAQKMVEAQELVQKGLSGLRVIVESNPQIQASGVVTKLMDELGDTANKVMYARRTLIDLTADFNRILITVPSSFVGKVFSIKPEKGLQMPAEGEHLRASKEETKAPKVEL